MNIYQEKDEKNIFAVCLIPLHASAFQCRGTHGHIIIYIGKELYVDHKQIYIIIYICILFKSQNIGGQKKEFF